MASRFPLAVRRVRSARLLRVYVRQHEGLSIKALADALRSDYKDVPTDTLALEEAGLLVKEGRKIKVPWQEVQANIVL